MMPTLACFSLLYIYNFAVLVAEMHAGKYKKSLSGRKAKMIGPGIQTNAACVVNDSHSSLLQVGWFPSTYVEEGEEWRVRPGKPSEIKDERQQGSEVTKTGRSCGGACSELHSEAAGFGLLVESCCLRNFPEAFGREEGHRTMLKQRWPHHFWLTPCG